MLGGSFDPVHFGHLNLALSIQENCGLDQILFVPASTSPFKADSPPEASSTHRLAMLKLAIAPIPAFCFIDWEIFSKEPCYTIDTVRQLSQDPTSQLHLILGEDQITSLHLWKEADLLLELAPLLIGSRRLENSPSLRFEAQKVQVPIFDISSTAIRKRIFQKKYCGHLIPSSVLEYIYQNHLYLHEKR